MNRGRHHQMNEIAKLAKKYGAKYPKAWSKGITYNTLVKLISTQEYFCKFNNLNIFETNFASSDITKGGFNWGRTEEGFYFWQRVLYKVYYGILDYKSKSNKKQ